MTAPPKITALAPYFGGKRNLAAAIVAELGPHRVYWEPFVGSMAVLIAKPPCVMETVNDLNGDLVNLARVIQHETLGPKLYRRLRRTLMSETFHREAAARWAAMGYGGDGEPDLERAYDHFLCSWLGRNGVAGTHRHNQGFCVCYTANGGHAATRWASVVDSIPAWRRRLRNVTILCRDAFEIIERIDDQPGAAIYVDPPYVEKGGKYIHDFEPADHRRLAEALGRFKRARVVVSYYEHPLVAELYQGWTTVRLKATKALVSQGRRDRSGAVAAPEVLLISGASYTATARQLF